MHNKRTDRIKLLKCLIAEMFILIFVGLIITSTTLAQWPPYNGYNWFSGSSLLNPAFSLSNLPYNTYSFTSSAFPSIGFRGSENYGTDVIYGNSPYNSSSFSFYDNSYMPLFSPSSMLSYPFQGGLYAGPTGYNPFSSEIPSSFSSNPYGSYSYHSSGINSSSWQWSPSFTPYPFTPPTVVPVYNPYQRNSNQDQPLPAPEFFRGEWESDEITDDKGDLILDRTEETLEIQDSSLSLGEGDLSSFTYTTTLGKAPISFKAEFDSGYTVRFTGTADNQRLMYTAGPFAYFEIKGKYVVKDDSNQTVDSGKFSLMYGSKPTL